MRLGDRLRQLRQEQNLTQQQLGERIDLNHRHLSRIEKGHVMPTAATVARIARALGLEVAALLQGVDDVPWFNASAAILGPRPVAQPTSDRLRARFDAVLTLAPEDQEAVIRVIDGLLARDRLQKLAADI